MSIFKYARGLMSPIGRWILGRRRPSQDRRRVTRLRMPENIRLLLDLCDSYNVSVPHVNLKHTQRDSILTTSGRHCSQIPCKAGTSPTCSRVVSSAFQPSPSSDRRPYPGLRRHAASGVLAAALSLPMPEPAPRASTNTLKPNTVVSFGQ